MAITYKSRLVLSCQNLSQKDVRCLIRKTDVERVLGNVGGCSGWFCGIAISNDGLEQLPNDALDKEPLWDNRVGGGWDCIGVEGVELALSVEARLTSFSKTVFIFSKHHTIYIKWKYSFNVFEISSYCFYYIVL